MRLEGLVASPGIATGRAALFIPAVIPETFGPARDPEGEVERVRDAARIAVEDLARIQDRVHRNMGADYAAIFRSQQTIAEDESILAEVSELVVSSRLCAEGAVRRVFDRYVELFADLNDSDYNKARVTDVEDVAKRILRNLLGISAVDLSDLERNTILVARELYPSDTVTLDARRVAGIITERGGPSSHVAILAKNLGIPAAVGVDGALRYITSRDTVVLDSAHSEKARILVNPGEESLHKIGLRQVKLRNREEAISRFRGMPSVTPDGVDITLSVNVGSTQELPRARETGARTVGLYRSEFLYLGMARLPDEETQYNAYRKAVETFADGFVIIRTLDIGGDKPLPSITLLHEDNPFLGKRALRLCLARPDIFRTQLRAILRAGACGPAKIMFPMVGGVPELDEALAMLESVKAELAHERIPHDPDMEVGIMIEVPSAVWVVDSLARRVDFFSIGTNDLTQYLLAADRLNSEVSTYYRIYDPALFRAIQHVADAARRHRRWVGVCGELGGNPRAIPVLIGLGVRELSMSPARIAEANWIVRETPLREARKLAREVLALDTYEEIREVLNRTYGSRIEALDKAGTEREGASR